MSDRWVTWVEPFGPNNEAVYMFVPETTAIKVQKKNAFDTHGFLYTSDEEALADFMSCYWAEFTTKPRNLK